MVLAPDASAGQDRGDPGRTGVYAAESPAFAGTVQWQANPGSYALTNAAHADGQLFVGSESGLIYVIDVVTSEVRLFNNRLAGSALGGLAVVDGRLYVGASDGFVHAFRLDGLLNDNYIWGLQIGGPVLGSPLIVDGVVYAGGAAGFFKAVDAESGAELWSAAIGDAISTSPAYADGFVVVGDDNSGLHAFSADDEDVTVGDLANVKSPRWSAEIDGAVAGNPVIVDGTVVAVTQSGSVVVLDLNDGSVVVEPQDGRAVTGQAAVAGGLVLTTRASMAITARDSASGEMVWTTELEVEATTGPMVLGQVVLVGTSVGTVELFDLASGEAIGSLSVGAPIRSLSYVDGVLYAICDEGVVIAIA